MGNAGTATAGAPLAAALLGALLAAAPARALEVPLAIDAASWKPVVFLDGRYKGLGDAEAAAFRVEEDPAEGPCLAVGPWLAGQWAARLERRERLPFAAGTLRGRYRTEGLAPTQTAVTVAFHAGERRVGKRTYRLAPAAGWRDFEVVFRDPPAGADSVVVAVGLDQLTGGTARFAALAALDAAPPLRFPDPPPLLRSPPAATLPPATRHRLRRLEGAWWLVAPDGRPRYSLGAPPPLGDSDPLEQGLALAAVLRSRGFNTLAGWTHLRSWSRVNRALAGAGLEPLPQFGVIDTSGLPASVGRLLDWAGRPAPGGGVPDPFDPAFAAAYEAEVRRALAAAGGGGSWLAGWFADSELPHAELYRYVWSPHAALALLEFLRGRHGTIRALNAAWGSAYGSFGAILAGRPDPAAGPEPLRRDFLDFERVLVARYVQVTLACFRAADPGRLVFSNRFAASVDASLERVLDLYGAYDGIGVNLYPENREPGLSADEEAFLRLVAERTGRPVLVAEWSVPALDSGLYDPAGGLDWSWNEAVGTQAERARQAAAVTRALYELPFVVGAHWFTWRDYDSERRRANRGLFAAGGAPWGALQYRLREANLAVAPPR